MEFIHIFIVLFFISISFIGFCIYILQLESNAAEYFNDVTSQIRSIFRNLDTNNDGYLDITEFLALESNYKILQFHSQKKISTEYEVQEFPHLPSTLGEQVIYIEADFQPLVLSSMKKDFSSTPKDELGTLVGLLNWKTAFKEGHPFGSKSFSLFLPEDASPKIGSPWWIINPELDKYSRPLSNERYFPPIVENKYRPLFALLSLFHPHLFLWTRFAPQGTSAVIRAAGQNFYDIIFRVHAEFQLNKPPLHPFWFTPSQFTGQLIINKDASVVKYFHMTVPNRKLNVDMEWLNGPTENNMEVDIGYIPKMSLISKLISAAHKSKSGANQNVSSIEWSEEISMETALDALELQFFPFKEVKYHSMPTAFHIAEAESKLVHGIILWGNLDDQSC